MPDTAVERITADELATLALFDGESRETLEWLGSLMEVRRFSEGDMIVEAGAVAEYMMVVLEGEIHFRRPNLYGPIVAPPREATGVLPFSRMTHWTGRGIAALPTRLAQLHTSHLRELVYRAPLAAQRLVARMTERTREFTRLEEGSNRLLALGKLAAGLAHELNNPASAAVRSSSRLREVLTERRNRSLALRGETIPKQAAEMIAELGSQMTECFSTPGSMDAIERADCESDMADWLESVSLPTDLASGLVEAGMTIDHISPLIPLVSENVATLGLRILIADHEILCLTQELEEASKRIADLVQSVKSYSYMDQSSSTTVDIEADIDVTLRMFAHQLKHGVEVDKEFAGNLPKIQALGSALNQVWTNLIDNALDAMEKNPADRPRVLHIRTHLEQQEVLVEIGDNGEGIPPDVKSHIFDPFFTTKTVGQGTGLGLDIVQRIVRGHQGSIRVESSLGRTVFQVRLPLQHT